jgi:mannose-6-phosphate isomerase-like protein (cupin superfamily)
MKSLKTLLTAVGLVLTGAHAWSQTAAPPPVAAADAPLTNWWSKAPTTDAGMEGPVRMVWAAHKNPETRYIGPNKPIWHIADILKAHRGKPRWEQQALLNRDFDGRYVQMASGDKAKCMFYADDRVWGWVYSGQLKVTIDGQEPKVLAKGWVFNVAPRLSYCMESVGSEPVVYFRITPAGQVPTYPQSETPTPIKGYTYSLAKIAATGGYDSFNVPFFNVDEYGASNRKGERFLYDGHTSSNLNIGPPITQLPPDTSWGHFHENMQEVWLDVYGNVCALISGAGVVRGEYGDLINANEERWHRATSCPNTGKSIRMAITPRSKEGQVHYYQTDAPPGN